MPSVQHLPMSNYTSPENDPLPSSLTLQKTRYESPAEPNGKRVVQSKIEAVVQPKSDLVRTEPDLFFSSLKITDKSALCSLIPSDAANVKSIDLSSNLLTEIDLTPLAHCRQLTCLMLNDNNLQSIDFTPLKDLKNLQKIWLQNNQLISIDVSPLKNIDSLKCLYLHNNKIHNHSLDLSPLMKLKNFSALTLKGNRLNEELDISLVLSTPNLTMFSVDDEVQLSAHYNTVVPNVEDFPQSLQKFYSRMQFKKLGQNKEGKKSLLRDSNPVVIHPSSPQIPDNGEPLFKALLLGFSPSVVQQIKDALFGVKGCLWHIDAMDYGQNAQDFVSSSSIVEKFNVFIVHPNTEAPRYVAKIRNSYMSSVIFVISDISHPSNESALATKLCIRFGASCVATLPLSPRSISLIKERAQKVGRKIDEEALVRSIHSPPPQNTNESRAQKNPTVSQLILSDNRIDFAGLKNRFSNGRSLLQSRLKLEEMGLKTIFAKNGNRITESEMSCLATLLGIPLSASTALFISILLHLESTGFTKIGSLNGKDSPASIITSVTLDDFLAYYEKHLKNRGVDARLHFVLASSVNYNSSRHLVGKNTIQFLMEIFIRRKNGILSALKSSLSSEDIAIACAEVLVHGLGAKTTVFSSSDFQRVNFCNKMLGAENGVYDGIFAPLRPDRFQNILKEFSRAHGADSDTISNNNSRLSREQMQNYCLSNRLMTRGAVDVLLVKNIKKEQGGLTLGDFAQFLLSINDPTQDSSANYFFSILDTNMDGRVCGIDLGFHYFEKQTEFRKQGHSIVPFVHVNRLVNDMIFMKSFPDKCPQSERFVTSFTRSQFLQTNKEGRGTLVKCMLFLNDDLKLVDVGNSFKKDKSVEAFIKM